VVAAAPSPSFRAWGAWPMPLQLLAEPHLGERPAELLLDAAIASESVVGVLVAGPVFEPLKRGPARREQLFLDGDLYPEVGDGLRWLR
jgi:hypothetical protein